MPTIDDGTLIAWAKAEADTRRAPGQGDYLRGIADGLESGILHLAERLQDPDVIEAGTIVLATEDGRRWNVMAASDKVQYLRYLPVALTAMLAKIAEVDTHEE